MSDSSRPSSNPPSSRKVWHALGYGLAALMVGGGSFLGGRASNDKQAENEPRSRSMPAPDPEAKPIPVPAKERATTDDGVIEMRLLRDQANQVFVEHRDQLAVDEAELCALKTDLRELWARLVQIEGGKRGAAARTDFEDRTVAWALCTPGKRIDLRALREAADSALRRR